MIDSDVPRADDLEVALESRCSRVRHAARGETVPDGVEVVCGRGGELDRLIRIEALLADGLGSCLAEGAQVAERSLEASLHVVLGIEVVICDQGAKVVRAQRDEHRIDELARPAGAIYLLVGIARTCLPGPQIGNPGRMGREKVAEVPGHAAEV